MTIEQMKWEDSQPKMTKRAIAKELQHYADYYYNACTERDREQFQNIGRLIRICDRLLLGRLTQAARFNVMEYLTRVERFYNLMTGSEIFIDYRRL